MQGNRRMIQDMGQNYYFRTEKLAVGYRGRTLIRDIDISVGEGKILTLIGPNGAGKSTILKTLIRRLPRIGGTVIISGKELHAFHAGELARQMAVVLTDRIRPELITCREVVAMGRYPYTNAVGRLTTADEKAVEAALRKVHAESLADKEFSTLSDGQCQRILLARALCQEPQILVLDEPTAYLDIRFKMEFLDILRQMARMEGLTVVMSLHEIDLAAKISDYLICVRGDTIAASGKPEDILKKGAIEELFGLSRGSYNRLYGSVELSRPEGEPRVFVVAGGGYGAECYRMLQKNGIPFATGILYENDIDCPVASALSECVVTAPAFEEMTQEQYERAVFLMERIGVLIDAGTPVGSMNRKNGMLIERAKEKGLSVYDSVGEMLSGMTLQHEQR